MGRHVRVAVGAVAGLLLLVASAVPALGQAGMVLEEYWAPGRGLHVVVVRY